MTLVVQSGVGGRETTASIPAHPLILVCKKMDGKLFKI